MLLSNTSEPLRDARRSFTRARICAAARAVFAEHGLEGATMEQIAQAAGTRRSTLYNHFRDKQEILGAIAREFGERLVALYATLPGGTPSREEIDGWVRAIVDFTAEERAPTVLLIQLGMALEAPAAVHEFGSMVMQALADRLPAFARALEPGPDQGLIRARASLVLRQIGFACAARLRGDEAASVENEMIVAAELFERFVAEHS